MSHDPRSYERQLDLVAGLERPESSNDRIITWCVGGGPLGVARSPEGRVEIFLAGPPVEPRSKLIRDNLEHQTWYRKGRENPLVANRLLLPAAGHFDHIAAFLCTELLRNGASTEPKRAFSRTEPVIELAIQRLRIADRAILGLCGEVLLLEALARAAPDERIAEVLDTWEGYRETARDLQLGDVGIEVKTTTRSTSSHPVQGVQQVEVGHGVDGVPESSLLLVSIGIQWAEGGAETSNSTSLPQLVDAIVARTRQAMKGSSEPVVAQLLRQITAYGSLAEIGYDHETMANSVAFQRPFRCSFVRCYDMTDPAIQVLRGDDVRARPHVDTDSVRFRINLPDQVQGDINPTVGLNESAVRILDLAGWG